MTSGIPLIRYVHQWGDSIMSNIRDKFGRVFNKRARSTLTGDKGSAPLSPAERARLMGDTSLGTSQGTLRSAWKIMRPYWSLKNGEASKKEQAIAYSLLLGSIGATVWQVTDVQVDIANWSMNFGDMLQNVAGIVSENMGPLRAEVLAENPELENDPVQLAQVVGSKIAALPAMEEQKGVFGKLLTTDFVILVGKLLAAVGVAFVLAQNLALRWRKWMTEKVSKDWLNKKAFYRLQNVYKNAENPDQRIQEDVNKFTMGSMSLVTDALGAVLTLGTFSTMLWSMSPTFNTASMGAPDWMHFNVHGGMFWAAAAYAGLGTYLTHKIGKPLSKLDYNQQKYEAFFRSDLIRVRENAEQIALNNGEEVEKGVLKDTFDPLYKNSKKIITKRKQLILSRAFYANMASPFPYIVNAPFFFTGQATIGTLNKTSYAFGQVQGALSWFIDNYQMLAEMKATTDRLGGFTDAIDVSNADLDLKEKKLAEKEEKPSAPKTPPPAPA